MIILPYRHMHGGDGRERKGREGREEKGILLIPPYLVLGAEYSTTVHTTSYILHPTYSVENTFPGPRNRSQVNLEITQIGP